MISGDRAILAGKRGAFWYTLEEFSKHWERIDVICPRAEHSGQWTEDSTTCHFENVFFHPSPWPLWKQPQWIAQKGKELYDEHHHDAMTVHEYPPFYNGIGALRLKKLTGIKAAAEIHHIVGHPVAASFVERIGYRMSRSWLPLELNRFDKVRVVNEEVADLLQSWGIKEDKLRVVSSFYLDAAFAGLALKAQKKVDVAFCARLEPNKGVLETIEAVAALPGVTLRIVGDGSQLAKAQKLVRTLHAADRITFAGWQASREDVAAEIAPAKMFVMHSKSEGGPRIALEAMIMGLPVLATKVGVMPDVIRDRENGMFVDGSKENLMLAIKSLLDDAALRTKLGSEATKIVDRFERKEAIRAYAQFLQTL